jgi:hypothetical protein
MGDERTYDERETAGRAALQAALAAAFAVRALEAQSTLYLYGSAGPTLVLWVHAWHALPATLAWLAAVGWLFCLALALSLAGIALQRRAQLAHVLPEAGRMARLHFGSGGGPVPVGSTILVWLATTAGGVLCLHALEPLWLRADVLQVSYKVWLILYAGALGSRYLEAS